ncbi:MAG: MinD/ParA family protein [Epsilonproteobacteria bacterium]|nr:MinD/ParA family protein [Campylobacterota bacterium]
MITQADKLKNLIEKENKTTTNDRTTKFIAITSGKGGVGKSTISANLGYALHKLGFRVALFDADIGLANLDVLLKVNAKKNILHVLKGEVDFKDIIVEIEDGFYLIPGDSGDEIIKYSDDFLFNRFLDGLDALKDIDFLVIDTGAGIGKEVQTFLNAVDEVLIITAPEPAAITDAYAMIKVLSEQRDRMFLLLNQVDNQKEANGIYQKISMVAKSNIQKDIKLQMIGYLKKDNIIQKASIKRNLFIRENPVSEASEQVFAIAKKIAHILERKVLAEEEKGLSRFFRKILRL